MKHGVAKRALGMALASAMVVSAVGTIPERDMKTVQAAGNKAIYVSSADYYNRAYDSRYAYDGNDLGCTYTAAKTTFKVWSPEADSVSLNMYSTGSDGEKNGKAESTKIGTYAMEKSFEADNTWKGVWEYTLEGDCKNQYYTYRAVIGGEAYPEAVDPYAKAVGVNGDRGMVVDLDGTDPDNWDDDYQSPKTTLSDSVIWEIDIRDFSISPSSGVSEENRGTYKAFTESATVNGEGKISSCVDYLKKMGVTHVQILPMFDFDDVDESVDNSDMSADNYNWGYNPKNYNVPEGSYSTNPYDGNVRIKETKQMIQALHDAGIQVVMDVVYNHTYATEDSNFNKIMRQQLFIKWEKCMQEIVEKYEIPQSNYLLPIIKPFSDIDERKQYIYAVHNINRCLKIIGKELGLSVSLTLYVARHAWASIAKSKNVPLSVISEGMGHDSEATTRIYLASLDTVAIDKANSMILKDL